MDNLVSILIPTYNRAASLRRAIESALLQSFKNIEVIVTDNSDNNDSFTVVNDFHDTRIKYIKNIDNIGPILNWRKALDVAQGDFCILLPDDDYFLNPFYVQDALALANAHDARLVITDCILGYVTRSEISRSGFSGSQSGRLFLDNFWKLTHIPTIANLFHRETAISLDAFSNNDILYSDVELWIKMLIMDMTIYCYTVPSVLYFFSGNNIVTNMSRESLINNSQFIANSIGQNELALRKKIVFRYLEFIHSIYKFNFYKVVKGVCKKNQMNNLFYLFLLKFLTFVVMKKVLRFRR